MSIWLRLRNKLLEDAYDDKLAELETDLAGVRLELADADAQGLDTDALLGFAQRLISKPAALWNDLPGSARALEDKGRARYRPAGQTAADGQVGGVQGQTEQSE